MNESLVSVRFWPSLCDKELLVSRTLCDHLQVMLFNHKIDPTAKLSTKGMVLDSIYLSSHMGSGDCVAGVNGSLTPVQYSSPPQDKNSTANDTKRNSRKGKKKSGGAENGETAAHCNGRCSQPKPQSRWYSELVQWNKFCCSLRLTFS